MHKNFISEKKYGIAVGIILLVIFAQLLYLINYEGAISDEQFYPGVGKYLVETGNFSLVTIALQSHPPLSYYINSLFLYPSKDPIWKQSPYSLRNVVEYYGLDYILLITRIPIALVSLLLSFYIYKWAKELYGKKAGLFALLLYAFEPTILAHSSFTTTDIVAVAFMFIAIYYLWRYDNQQTKTRLAIAGVTLGLALLTKYSALILVPLTFAFLIYKYHKNIREINTWKIIVGYFSIAFLIVWASYGFQFSTISNEIHSKEKAMNFIDKKYSGFTKEVIITGMNIPIPATTYIGGLGYNVYHSAVGHYNYFFGEVSLEAKWYYHPIIFLSKSPIPLLIILAILISGIIYKKKTIKWKDEKYLIIPIIVYLIFLWFIINLNLGLRHSLPIYPFMFVLASSIISFKFKASKGKTIYKIVLTMMIIWYIVEALFILPHNLSYFNEFVGSENGWLYFADTDVDWGGYEVKEVGKYVRSNNITDFKFTLSLVNEYARAYIDPNLLGDKDWEIIPGCKPKNGIYVATTSQLTLLGNRECYKWLLNYSPVDKIGYSMFIYNITDVEVS